MSTESEQRVAVVIEDDDDIRHLLETVLSQAGFRVVATPNGAAGVEAVRENNPVVTTLDVNMPGMDGFEVARRIRGFSSTYIVMLTALNEEIDTLQGLEAGADDYINKPFRPRELRARIEAMLRRPRTNRLADGTVVPESSDVRTDAPAAQPAYPQNPAYPQAPAAPEQPAYQQPGYPSQPPAYPSAPPQQPAYPAQQPAYPSAPAAAPQTPPPAAYPSQQPAFPSAPPAQPAYQAPPLPPTWEQTGQPPAAGQAPQQTAMPAAQGGNTPGIVGRGSGWMEHNGLWLNFETRVVQSGQQELDLTRSEFDLLAALMESGRRVRTKADLVLLLRGESYVTSHFISEADKRAIEVHMGNLRKKIGDTTGTPKWIETVRGVGYRLTAPSE